jgi:FAD:protein FMN transferase
MTARRFTAMGCEVLVAGAGPGELRAIRDLFSARERRFSRFRDDSELQRVNRARGPVVVSGEFAGMLRLALWAASVTDGLVDPTVGPALVAAGYDRDFAQLGATPAAPARAAAGASPGPSAIVLHGRVLSLPGDSGLDLNGVVKSATVDDALSMLPGEGWVSAGGDIAARGGVGVRLPGGGSVQLEAGGMATSGRTRRSWPVAGGAGHHLIDPATGDPSQSPWEQVTVCGRSCLDADVAAKAAFLLGDAGPAWLDDRRIPGRFVAEGGRVSVNEAWRAAVPAGHREQACT